MKNCTKCSTEKPLSEFTRNSRAKDGLAYWCRDCNSRFKGTEEFRAHKRDYVLEYKFGLTRDDYNKMLSDQNGCCKICRTHQSDLSRRLAVDHCHLTGKIRGLLCVKCNTGIGSLRDDIELLKSAIEYLSE